MKKITIDVEIIKLKNKLDELEDIHPDYISVNIKELQSKVLATHAHIENALENRIRYQVLGYRNINNSKFWDKAAPEMQRLLNLLSFRNKVEIIEDYKDADKELIKSIKKLNHHRITFAHPKGSSLRKKYDLDYPKCKENVRDLLRCLVNTNRLLDEYFDKYLTKKL